jgi:tetratricopeptide (TPR) repeat protein
LRPPVRRTGWGYQGLSDLLAVLTALVTLGPQVSGLFEQAPAWLPYPLYLLAAMLAVAPRFVERGAAQRKEDVEWLDQVDELLALPRGPDGQLPRLSTLSPYRLGTSPSRYGNDGHRGSDLYVRREIDKKLAKALREKPFVLVVGAPLAGKSRTAYYAARHLIWNGRRHDLVVLVPKSAAAVKEILKLKPPLDFPKPTLLWLDGLTEGDLAPLTDVLDGLADEMIVLASITAKAYDNVSRSDSAIDPKARQALARAYKVRLEAKLTTKELSEAHADYPDEEFKAGIGEQLVAPGRLLDRYDNARQGVESHGWAIVQAAIDWVRIDVGRPIRQSELAALYPIYLADVRPNDEPRSDLPALLEWACEPVSSHLALLQRHADGGEPSFLPFGYLVAIADGQDGRPSQPIPDSTWDQLPSLATPREVLRAALSAYYRNLSKWTKRLLQAVIDSGDAVWAGLAAARLGVLLEEQGDIPGAKAAYRQAIAIGHTESAGPAVLALGVLLQEQRDLSGAKDAYRQAIATRHAESAGNAALRLGFLLQEQGDISGATAAYRQAIAIGHTESAGPAALTLGVLLREQGDIPGARAAYRQTIAIGHAESAGPAAVELGMSLREEGDIPGATAAYRQAIATRHAESAGKAAAKLGFLLQEQRDLSGAKDAYRQAINSGHAESAGLAALALGVLLREQGDIPGAKAAYRQAIAIGHAASAGPAAGALDEL